MVEWAKWISQEMATGCPATLRIVASSSTSPAILIHVHQKSSKTPAGGFLIIASSCCGVRPSVKKEEEIAIVGILYYDAPPCEIRFDHFITLQMPRSTIPKGLFRPD